jgi:flagellar L-ring protein precursor FlgH
MHRKLFFSCLAAAICAAGSSAARAQSGGLPYPGEGEMPFHLPQRSWWYQQLPPVRKLKKHDIVTVVVNVKAQVLSDGSLERRKRANLDAVLSNWVRLDGLALKPAPQRDGDPRVTGALNSQYRADGQLETKDRMQFTIAAKVADVLPNGQLIIEAQQMITNNEEVWKQTLRGCVRPEDVQPNNKVLSENIADLTICKEEAGSVPDSYRRGWLGRFYDYIAPF